MKKLFLIFTSLAFILTSLPSFAITEDSTIIPFIGSSIEKANEYIDEKVDLAPIKLPEKVGNFELLEAERALLPHYIKDQTGLWTSPLRLKVKDLKWVLPASGVLTALLLTDDKFSRVLTNDHNPSKTQTDIAKAFAQIGGYAPVLGTPGGLILLGAVTKNDRLRETGILQYEALGNVVIVGTVSQLIAGRNKPNNDKKGRGDFFEGGSSFPSGHSISSWALVSVASHQYPDKKWVPILGYSLASLISASRGIQGTHYPADIFAGALMGYLIGKYVVKHNSKLSPKYKDKKSNQ